MKTASKNVPDRRGEAGPECAKQLLKRASNEPRDFSTGKEEESGSGDADEGGLESYDSDSSGSEAGERAEEAEARAAATARRREKRKRLAAVRAAETARLSALEKVGRRGVERSAAGVALERELVRVATRGVVQLFNAVGVQQTRLATSEREAGSSGRKRDAARAKAASDAPGFLAALEQREKKEGWAALSREAPEPPKKKKKNKVKKEESKTELDKQAFWEDSD